MAGIYLHIPFCHHKCYYCDFYSMPKLEFMPRLVEAIIQELKLRYKELEKEPINTIYIGGGTPSLLPYELISQIINQLPKSNIEEFTIEVNPEDVTIEKALQWIELGINRISMGVQSFVDQELKSIGRSHDSKQALKAAQILREAGFKNISMDLIYGLPGQDIESWTYSLNKMIELNPEHISSYSLTFEPRTRMTAMLKKGEINEASEEKTIQFYEILCTTLSNNGFIHYEISNFSKPSYQAKHNSNYWNFTPYLGLGPSAHSFDGTLRRVNPSNLKKYLSEIENGNQAYEIEPEDTNNRFNDKLITALRTSTGLRLEDVNAFRREQLLSDSQPFLATNHLYIENGFLKMTEKSWLISDTILTNLIQI